MQVPPVIPKVTAPAPNELKPEPVTRAAPVVMNDAATRPDPSVILKTPVPVTHGNRLPNAPRPALDQEGPIYISPLLVDEEASETTAHLTRLLAQIGKAESGPHTVRWPTTQNGALSSDPRGALESLKQSLANSSMLALAMLANGSKTQAETTKFLQRAPAQGSGEVQQGLTLLMHGQLLWQGEFTPGVPARIYREDAYGEDAYRPGGPLVKGTQISIELSLPTLGTVQVNAVQIQDSISISLRAKGAGKAAFSQNLQALKDHLAQANMSGVQVHLQAV
jgi:hypothetical protein